MPDTPDTPAAADAAARLRRWREAHAQIEQALTETDPADAAQLRVAMDAEDQVTLIAHLKRYYADLDRADRTPRVVLYLTIGMLLGALDSRTH